MATGAGGVKVIALNRAARHEYFVLETLEAGISLAGTEVKSIRAGGVNLKEAWVDIQNGEAYILGMHVSPYEQGNIFNKDPFRARKLLLHKSEIRNLHAQIKKQGHTLVPLRLYFKNAKVKVEIGLCQGKKLHDKRQTLARRDAQREVERAIKERSRS
ncbi:SsrA-binding protein SmpB [Ruminococcaceae bacterium OttesenSCG-928-N02]|nr:SsrA-binding protein SmpB [Ruminococcaceae bacterium OttesenSCG-928-N02]